MNATVGSLKQEGEHAIRAAAANPLAEKLIRLGYVVRGLIYCVIGLLALRVATGRGGALADQQGAIAAMGSAPAGKILLYVVLAGLAFYALWGVIRALADPLHQGHGAKGIAQRLGYLTSGIAHGLLARTTYGLITAGASAARNGAGDAQTQQATASILAQPWGPWVIALAAVIVIGVGLVEIYRGCRRQFNRQYQLAGRTGTMRKWIGRLGRFGTIARGVVFSLAGVFLFLAAYHHNASRAQGIDGILKALLHEPFGPWLLGAVAAGFIAFGIYSAMIRRVVEM